MNERVLAAFFLIGALAVQVTLPLRAPAQEERQHQSKDENQQRDQVRNKHQEQQRQFWNGDYRYEDTVDRDWLNEHQHYAQKSNQYPSWETGFRYEETVDRNWLNEHKQE
jgi:hypothetical protein